ncbi:cation-translocating P-type ATPase [Candidatus Bathycorpusculum sp.]|uniref:heavy metal translocating P-type ATPase n=1 Tax=Candidatus Bathycorpusculum sp. TaxID=2994959 RepID=UPI0028328D5F|nr:cation-translocating P-type ATPase [Candidatus Termitimicrobium sp.]MCL2685914.1 cation-translocating P-type ATPase [Candidatus Termitimicrobium sp.]
MDACEEKPTPPRKTIVIGEEEENKKVLVGFAVWLGITVLAAGLLDLFLKGIPLGFTFPLINIEASVSMILYYVAIIVAAVYIGVVGLKELVIERRFSVEFLMAVAGLGALLLDYRFEAATVLFLYCIAEYFEGYIQDRARRTVEKISQVVPEKARIIADGREVSVNVDQVQTGAVVLVRPGERIPLDGDVIEGFSHVDQSLVTGESVPVPKKAKDCVYAGTLNTGGVLQVVVTKKSSETLVSRIIQLVIESQKRKATIERLVDRFARFYVPIILGLAVFTTAVLPFVFGGGFETWFYRSLILIVVSCPSAFIISVPATVFIAITIAAKRGVIIKGGIFIEKLAQVKQVVFDKTGTLTLGQQAVHRVHRVDISRAEDESVMYAAALDQYSNHPIARAIVRRAVERGIDLSKIKVSDVVEVPGKGIVGMVEGKHVAIGNPEFMEELGCDCMDAFEVTTGDTHTAVCISVGKTGWATICVVDQVREDALQSIGLLKQQGVRTVMLSGDREAIANDTAKSLGIDEVHAELLPQDKLSCIEHMRGKEGLVAMVGDGVNDAPALAASDVGIAMGTHGVDVALESADVVLVNDELSQIPYLLKLSQKTMGIAKQNIAGSLAIKFALGALGLLGWVPLWFTVAAGDDGLTLLLLLNTLRLERLKS